MTPTTGLYFFADEYIKFLTKLNYYMSIPMTIVPVQESTHYDVLKLRNQLHCPIGRLDDIEVVFQHYHSGKEAVEKWERRKKRINWDNLIIKFSNMNYCTDEDIKAFLQLSYDVKFVFVNTQDRKEMGKECIFVKGYEERDGVMDDTKHYDRYLNLTELINNHRIVPNKTLFLK